MFSFLGTENHGLGFAQALASISCRKVVHQHLPSIEVCSLPLQSKSKTKMPPPTRTHVHLLKGVRGLRKGFQVLPVMLMGLDTISHCK